MGFPKRGVCKLRASLNSLRLQQMLRCIACDEKTRDKLTQEIHEGHYVGMMISKFASSSTFPSCSSFQVLPKTSWNIILGFFFAVLCCCQNTSKTRNFTSMIRSFHSENPVKSWDSMPFDLLARQCCPKTCGCEIWSLRFVAVVGPLPLSFHSTMLGRSGQAVFKRVACFLRR